MNLVQIIALIFIVVESANIYGLYFKKESKKFNSTGIFKALEQSKSDPNIYDFVKYLINWVAGVKVIVIGLLIVIVFLGDKTLQLYAFIALILAISTFYIGLYPIIKKMDAKGQIEPKNYSRTLLFMITSMIAGFIIGLIQVYA